MELTNPDIVYLSIVGLLVYTVIVWYTYRFSRDVFLNPGKLYHSVIPLKNRYALRHRFWNIFLSLLFPIWWILWIVILLYNALWYLDDYWNTPVDW